MRLFHSVGGLLPLVVVGILGVPAQPANAADALKFFKNYFVTGDYAIGGTGLQGLGKNGFATGKIAISGVPAQADILAAFLYWATVEHTPGSGLVGAKFGYPDLQLPMNDISKIA
jgi:hypothetical protein